MNYHEYKQEIDRLIALLATVPADQKKQLLEDMKKMLMEIESTLDAMSDDIRAAEVQNTIQKGE